VNCGVQPSMRVVLTLAIVLGLAGQARALAWFYWATCDSQAHGKTPWRGAKRLGSSEACAEAERHRREHPDHHVFVMEGEGNERLFDCSKRCFNGVCGGWQYWAVCYAHGHEKVPWTGEKRIASSEACAEAAWHRRRHPGHHVYVVEGEGEDNKRLFDCSKRCFNGVCE